MEDTRLFTIDLLKGQGIPIKSRPEGVAVAVVTFAVPAIIAIVMFSCYLHTRIVISIQKQRIVNYETKIGELSDTVELQKSFEKEKSVVNSCLSEVSSSIGRHIQWSPVLVTLAENMPDSVLLTALDVKQRSLKRKVPGKDDPKKMVDVTVPARTLHMSVCGSSQSNCDNEVKDFRDRLRLSPFLEPKLEGIIVSQDFDTLGDQDVVSYQIDCVFKPGL
jgi:Tfp pilus assembly protein PilN